MGGLVKMSDAVSLAFHTMEYLARRPENTVSAKEIAEAYQVSEHHLAKVHQRLARAGLISSVRGPRGGVRLNRNPVDVSLLEVYEAIEGAVPQAGCLFGTPVCGRVDCILGDMLQSVNQQVRATLESTTLAVLQKGGLTDGCAKSCQNR